LRLSGQSPERQRGGVESHPSLTLGALTGPELPDQELVLRCTQSALKESVYRKLVIAAGGSAQSEREGVPGP
jgi:hypothetical protein